MSKFRIFNLLIIIALFMTACKGKKSDEQVVETKQIDTLIMQEEPIFDIVTNLGTIKVKLYKETPLHRDNFVKLASEGFYDGILFHRVIKGFMIQAGDPYTKDMANERLFGTGGPGYTVAAEILPEFSHKKGALAAARRGDGVNPNRESSGSQFYIVEDPIACSSLDGDYTIFGETISGFEVIDAIAAVETNQRDMPINPVKIISVKPVLED
jgi:cyclophilin family peptidyl-prolyl cis-trans isomerase